MFRNTCADLAISAARVILPTVVRRALGRSRSRVVGWRKSCQLRRLRRRAWSKKAGTVERCFQYVVRATDGPNYYIQYKDEFVNRIYHFDAARPNPVIIDGGSNIGMSVLYFKMVYPRARIVAFEPDPKVFGILQENVSRNCLADVQLVNAGLGSMPGTVGFLPDGSAGGRFGGNEGDCIEVRVELLSDYLDQPVDFVKLNIEGEELPVLQEAAARGKLRNVRELVVEYHGWAGGEQRLGEILKLLDQQGFRYLVHDFDAESCSTTKPPFRYRPEANWFCLVYGRRLDNEQDTAWGEGSEGREM